MIVYLEHRVYREKKALYLDQQLARDDVTSGCHGNHFHAVVFVWIRRRLRSRLKVNNKKNNNKTTLLLACETDSILTVGQKGYKTVKVKKTLILSKFMSQIETLSDYNLLCRKFITVRRSFVENSQCLSEKLQLLVRLRYLS